MLANVEVADDIYQMQVDSPQIAATAEAGQFVHVRVAERPDQFLRMPFTVFDAHPGNGILEIVYQVVGDGTRQLSQLAPGARVDTIGATGRGWEPPEHVERALVIGGGVGTPALNLLARNLAAAGTRVDAVIGAATKAKFCCLDALRASVEPSGGELRLTTDDGSYGTHGFVTAETDALIASGDYGYVAVCGPTPMMRNTVKPALANGTPCQVSMETLMACGVGACFSCVVDTVAGKKRCCTEGPVFDAREVVW